ncbi:acyltransferase [Butyrivibrio sp. NC2002]|uniref:acyltransferase n=1 Tax=Butyrivibrio sp. NC2002 TaxID=1410610 RepID=UPI00068CA2CB|nr:acyltransferase [Butyrivibrio sp. NC2002]
MGYDKNIYIKIKYKLKIVKGIIANYKQLRKYKVKYGKNFILNGKAIFHSGYISGGKTCNGRIYIGDNVSINSGITTNLIGGNTCSIFRTIEAGNIIIGNNVGISNAALVAMDKIVIEDGVLIGGGVIIYDNDFHSINSIIRSTNPCGNIIARPVLIKRGAFIGAHSIILKGVVIGENSIVGAGSVVTKNIPDGEVWAGNPARFIKKAN